MSTKQRERHNKSMDSSQNVDGTKSDAAESPIQEASEQEKNLKSKRKSKHSKPTSTIDAAVKELIRDKGISVLSYPQLFKRGIRLTRRAPGKDEKREEWLVKAIMLGFGAVIVVAERGRWTRECTSEALNIHFNRKPSKHDCGSEEKKYRHDYLLGILDWYRKKYQPSIKLCEKPEPFAKSWWNFQLRRSYSAIATRDEWLLKNMEDRRKNRNANLTTIAVAIIGAMTTLLGIVITARTSEPKKTQDETVAVIGYMDKLDTISGQLEDLLDLQQTNNSDKLDALVDLLKEDFLPAISQSEVRARENDANTVITYLEDAMGKFVETLKALFPDAYSALESISERAQNLIADVRTMPEKIGELLSRFFQSVLEAFQEFVGITSAEPESPTQ